MRSVTAWLAVAVGGVVLLSACGSSPSPDAPVTVTSTKVVSPQSSSTAAPSTSAAAAGDLAVLQASWRRKFASIDATVAVSVVGVGTASTQRVDLGSLPTQVAWSTIKVPLAVAAERRNGPMPATAAAITQSDNSAAETLWASLGTDRRAAGAVTAVLAEGGSSATVPSTSLRPPYTIFGQTRWPVPDAATFTAHLPCMAGTARVMGFMGHVGGNQQWGVEVMRSPASTAVKGGWGPAVSSGYVVRQIGFITLSGGDKAAIAMTTYSPGLSMSGGIAVLNRVATWLNANVQRLPAGNCR